MSSNLINGRTILLAFLMVFFSALLWRSFTLLVEYFRENYLLLLVPLVAGGTIILRHKYNSSKKISESNQVSTASDPIRFEPLNIQLGISLWTSRADSIA